MKDTPLEFGSESDEAPNAALDAAGTVLTALFPDMGIFLAVISEEGDRTRLDNYCNMEQVQTGRLLRRLGLTMMGAQKPANEDES